MSQALTPINGGQLQVTTTLSTPRRKVISEKAVELRKLYPQATEWVPGGRPIYGRLPSVSESYQIDFFEEKTQGWVYIPYGEGIFGPNSLEVVSSDDNQFIIIKGGNIVWEYGQISINPTIINCSTVGLQSTRYLIGYQLLYDDAPFDAQYSVSDFSLSGYDLEISSSTDDVVGWKYPPVNCFLNNSYVWKTRDESFPTYAQPTQAFLTWKSKKYAAYSNITLRCPANTVYTGSASLYNKIDNQWYLIQETSIQEDSASQFFKFELDNLTFQEEWKVEWSTADIAIEAVLVSGVLTILSNPATGTTRYALVAYPENAVPKEFENSLGEKVPLVICKLAYVDVDELSQVIKIDDVRDIVYRDYKPVAEWLTRSQDKDLIDLYEIVSDYSGLWLEPQSLLKYEYEQLADESIQLSNSSVLGS